MLSQCSISDFMKTWLSAEDESSIDSFSSKTVHFLIPHVLCRFRRLVFIPFFKCLHHSSYENHFYTVAMKRRRWGSEIAQLRTIQSAGKYSYSERDSTRVWKEEESGEQVERDHCECEVSGNSTPCHKWKKLSFETWKDLSVCKVKEEVGDFRYTLTFIFWWKIEEFQSGGFYLVIQEEDRLLFAESADYKEPFEILKFQKWFAVVAMSNIKSKSSKEIQC